MIIPKHWAEARLRQRARGRYVTVRRFGWSDESVASAQAHADARVREAMDRILAGEALPRRERRVAYNGADGVPIREEIVDRHGENVITRNGYGALCLNTPDVLFADIDRHVDVTPGHWLFWRLLAGAVVALATLWIMEDSSARYVRALVAGLFGGLVLGGTLSRGCHALAMALRGGFEAAMRKRIARFVARNPGWNLRVYRTPAGLRLLATHRRFDPREPEVKAFFDTLGVDPTYARMCFNQRCFRARISPKPWRIGLPRLRPPHSAAWREAHADLPERRAWIERYESASRGHASCRHVETIGSGIEVPEAVVVRDIHDLFSRADSALPMA